MVVFGVWLLYNLKFSHSVEECDMKRVDYVDIKVSYRVWFKPSVSKHTAASPPLLWDIGLLVKI